ncbi:MAG: oxygen-independent coproporphyrinogen III oxidase HemN [Idiomarinaceae bacterium HL-53]|nr:MAG: oxygen-independent coproporphyrinogen III oxidase HemN [Idiomarinaceae bacterium HL-53]CUS47742.1 oxygen-independent coproporphyrinogen-3 oxidase [Idiomarinaceae bacterium HL-53]
MEQAFGNLLGKYDVQGPRYTSYPTALSLSEDFSQPRIIQALTEHAGPLSLYVHLPFCHKLCYYCGCNRVITRHQEKADEYLNFLEKEMQNYSAYTQKNPIQALHLGGGTPTFLTEQQLSRLMDMLRRHFRFEPARALEVSIEIDPRSCSLEKLAHLRSLGFNRVSYGVQDINEATQIAINRVQPLSLVQAHVTKARELGFESINLDLVYGLPLQTPTTFAQAVEAVIKLAPERVSLFSYAHLPTRFAAQRKIPTEMLPQGKEKLALMLNAAHRFQAAGYQFIGMDHFAKPSDSLAKAQRSGELQRNFQGYTTHGTNSLLGLGVSSISQVNGIIWQHEKELSTWRKAIAKVQLPIAKAVALSADDVIRGDLIADLICHFRLDIDAFAHKWQIDFHEYFANSLPNLYAMEADGLIELTPKAIQVTELGRWFVRVICGNFDAYLNPLRERFSKVV